MGAGLGVQNCDMSHQRVGGLVAPGFVANVGVEALQTAVADAACDQDRRC